MVLGSAEKKSQTNQKKCLYADICPHMSLGGLKNTLCGHRTYVHEMWAYVDICHAAIFHSAASDTPRGAESQVLDAARTPHPHSSEKKKGQFLGLS